MISPQRQWRYRICPGADVFPVGPRTPEAAGPIGIIGPGRAGVGLALALAQAGYSVFIHGRKKKNVPIGTSSIMVKARHAVT